MLVESTLQELGSGSVSYLIEAIQESAKTRKLGVGGTELVFESAVLVALASCQKERKSTDALGSYLFVVGPTIGFCAIGCVALVYFCGGERLLQLLF